MLSKQLRLKAAISISGGVNNHLAMGAFKAFASNAIARIATRPIAMLLVTQMVGQLRI